MTLLLNRGHAADPDTPGMPAVWEGRRRTLLLTLLVLSVVQAVLALTMTFSVDQLLEAAELGRAAVFSGHWQQLVALVGSVLGIGLARWLERVVAEDLGQDYVFEQRHRLVTSALGGNREGRSLGVIVTRASNDLTAIRNWIALGIVPLLTAVPMILIVLLVLSVQNWAVAVAVSIPIMLMVVVLPGMAQVAHTRARKLRRHRGRMSARIADLVRAGESVQAAGAIQRELKAVDRDSIRVVDAAVERAAINGLIRALTVTAASLATVAVVVVAAMGLVSTAGVASIMTLLGILATPLGDLGRVVEYRQNYKAARRILAPMLSEAEEIKQVEKAREKKYRKLREEQFDPAAGLRIRHLVVNGRVLPELVAKPGERIQLSSGDPGQIRRTVQNLMTAKSSAPFDTELAEPEIEISGVDVGNAPGKVRRDLLGFASVHIPLERGSVRRLVSLRIPDASDEEVREVLERVGLKGRIERGVKGMELKLKNGGQPLTPAEVMRLKLARALLRRPAVLLLEGVDSALDVAGVELLRGIIRDYPGVVLFSSHDPGHLAGQFREWGLDGPALLPEHFHREWGSAAADAMNEEEG
ncbi:Heterocyst differentiation ATP-binding protein HepA [Corynebacterium occultum]|uniref:Heterocyst differentiation ATP-binding protein HepA n=1 Tax=Corynebacterium occultum TaxID=2675219 RepID=A0A6B8W8C0_9CORY|nr:Heterocyst differentiation ATP-binding protein HepA [Corynebacterium occultum]